MTTERHIAGDGYAIHYGGGRLADVVIDGSAVECVQVRDYNTRTGEFGPEPDDASIRASVAEFLAESGGIGLYVENMA
jgi:hypothetical protein